MKVALVVLGTIAFLMGLADSLAGALVPHGRGLIIWGLIGLAIAGVLHLRKKWRQKSWKAYGPLVLVASAIFGATDACAETIHAGTLTPPDKWPVQQWNPNAVSGFETWLLCLLIGAGLGLAYWYIAQGLGRYPCQPWKKL